MPICNLIKVSGKCSYISFSYSLLQLWVGSGSRAAEEKQFFDTRLAPFYRIEQVSHFYQLISLSLKVLGGPGLCSI